MPQHAPLERLLTAPACRTLAEPLRALLRHAADAAPPVCTRDAAIVADLLAALDALHADGEMVAAALLDALPGWADAVQPAIAADHAGIATLLDGQHAAARVWALHAEQRGRGGHEGLRRLLLAIVRDLRVVPVLLAMQLARMRAAAALPPDEAQALARLTRDIHAPLANRLGIWQLKWELEDLAFRYLEPDAYRRIAHLLDDNRAGRERYVDDVGNQLRDALAAQGLRADVAGRPKHIYSIWKKMQKKRVPIGALYDLRALRVLVDDVQGCYAALGLVHALWSPVPGEFDDYIARPKHNDYRSLHTAVMGPEGKTVEVQIRTHEMHAQAELGVAAHWRYKEHAYDGRGRSQRAGAGEAALNRKIEWMRRLLESGDGEDDGALARGLEAELVEDRIYALTPRGEVIDLPRGATPLDFAYHVHTEVGHRCRGAKVDGRIVPLDHVLASGDRVEILTGKVSEPRRDWLLASNGFLASTRSREKVRVWFHRLDRERNLQAGRDLLERELKRLGLQRADPAPALRRFQLATLEDLQLHVALGDIGPHQVARALLDHERAAEPAVAPAGLQLRAPRGRQTPAGRSAFTVLGVGNLLVQIARCCRPLPGEPIAGYLTRGRGVSVHRADCAALLRLQAASPQRAMAVEWSAVQGVHEADIVVHAIDRRHLLKDVTNLMAQEDTHVLSIAGDVGGGGVRVGVRLQLRVRVQDHGQLSRLLGKVEALPGVERARRA